MPLQAARCLYRAVLVRGQVKEKSGRLQALLLSLRPIPAAMSGTVFRHCFASILPVKSRIIDR